MKKLIAILILLETVVEKIQFALTTLTDPGEGFQSRASAYCVRKDGGSRRRAACP